MAEREKDHSKYKSWIDPNEVKPYPRNAKKHTKRQIQNIVNSIRRFGWQQDVVITSDNVLVIGHGRRLAAIELGCEMPYHRIDKIADELTDEDIRELRYLDNKLNAMTDFNANLEALELMDLSFDGFDIQDEFNRTREREQHEDQVKALELKAFEHYDYICFVFRNQMDWLYAVNLFGLERVDASYGETKKIGIGRVIEGKRLLEILGHKDSDSVQGTV